MANHATDSYGSARWAVPDDLRKESLFSFAAYNHNPEAFRSERTKREYLGQNDKNRGMILSRLGNPAELMSGIRAGYESCTRSFFEGLSSLFRSNSSNGSGNLLGWAGDGHIITIAPTRSGKGVGLVVPNLLHYPGSVLVVDPKGENYAITAEFRRRVLKQEIICLDPFHVMGNHTDSINPLDGLVDYRKKPSEYLKLNPEIVDSAANIAEAMIMRSTSGNADPHWDDKARSLLKGLILAVICGKGPNHQRHLSEVRALLTQPKHKFEDFLIDLAVDKAPLDGMLSRAANEILSCATEERSSVISAALKHTEFLDSQLVCNALGDYSDACRGSYDLSNLKTMGGVSIYMIIPPHHLSRYVRCIRLWVTMAMAAMTRHKGTPADGCSVLFMLDEMAQLGTMEMMRQAVSLLAGYGMSIWMVWQDLSQLKALYEHDWATFLANAKVQQYFGINDHETAKFVSEMLGAATICVTSHSTSENNKAGFFFDTREGNSTGVSVAEVARNLLNPDEVRRLNRKALLTFVQGIPPILGERITYYTDPMFAAKAAPNPYIVGSSSSKR